MNSYIMYWKLSILQFECENGRIILSVNSHLWHKNELSSEFKHNAAPDFISHWASKYNSAGNGMTRKRNLDQVGDFPSQTNTIESGASAAADNGKSAVIHDSMSPSKRAKYIKEGIDETIEKGKVGKS